MSSRPSLATIREVEEGMARHETQELYQRFLADVAESIDELRRKYQYHNEGDLPGMLTLLYIRRILRQPSPRNTKGMLMLDAQVVGSDGTFITDLRNESG